MLHETQRKKKKKQPTTATLSQELSESGQELIEFLEKLEDEKKYLDVQVCPKCKSPKVKRVGTMDGDLWSNMGLLHPKYECSDCGWSDRILVKVTNRLLTVRDVEIIAEALDGSEK
jgi:ribosomal protein L37AE/L43A